MASWPRLQASAGQTHDLNDHGAYPQTQFWPASSPSLESKAGCDALSMASHED